MSDDLLRRLFIFTVCGSDELFRGPSAWSLLIACWFAYAGSPFALVGRPRDCKGKKLSVNGNAEAEQLVGTMWMAWGLEAAQLLHQKCGMYDGKTVSNRSGDHVTDEARA